MKLVALALATLIVWQGAPKDPIDWDPSDPPLAPYLSA